ncbi:hypothetical protein [Solimonas flava]|uniref:hypothetical protein n=1 Tax=Solimonas flava TaxID=415849 RepID=UPI000419D21C|nr:hypothetical protein [Solimonas flava]
MSAFASAAAQVLLGPVCAAIVAWWLHRRRRQRRRSRSRTVRRVAPLSLLALATCGSTAAQRDLGDWSDGVPVHPLAVTDTP